MFFYGLISSFEFDQELLLSESFNRIDVDFDSVVIPVVSCKGPTSKSVL